MMSSIQDVVLFVFALGATLLSLAWITIMWHTWYGESSVRIAITAVLAIIGIPSWFIVSQYIWKALFI